jgi:hypothetical protein
VPPERRTATLRAAYTVAELARVGNVSTKVMRRLLADAGVPVVDEAPRRSGLVRISDVRRLSPVLWDSLQEVESVTTENR